MLPAIPLAIDTAGTTPRPAVAFLASAVLPGLGQHLLDQKRAFAYAAVELGAWAYALERRHRGNDLAADYRDLAWQVARHMRPAPRRDGAFDYYEALLHYGSSGAFDADPARAGLQPERREDTYNGAVWVLAQELYLPAGENGSAAHSTALESALAYYRDNAIQPEFAWDWAGSTGAREQYGDLMRESDEGLRRATIAFGAILANHLVSALDALLAARLRGEQGGAAASVGVESRLEPRPDGLRWMAGMRIAWP